MIGLFSHQDTRSGVLMKEFTDCVFFEKDTKASGVSAKCFFRVAFRHNVT